MLKRPQMMPVIIAVSRKPIVMLSKKLTDKRPPHPTIAPPTEAMVLERPCGACNPVRNPLVNQGWWLEFGLDCNPYVYGPMPRLRTSVRYRLEEARRMGWMAWTWNDEYMEERKGLAI